MPEMKVLKSSYEKPGWPLYEVWEKYENVAIHFNDLLLRLRLQALGGVAALSTLVGIFTKTDVGIVKGSWQIAAVAFLLLAVFWVAIWMVDLLYYNRLLIGSVVAIFEVEQKSKTEKRVNELVLSTRIADAVNGVLPNPRPRKERFFLLRGVWAFYVAVWLALLGGCVFSFYKHCTEPAPLARSLVVPV